MRRTKTQKGITLIALIITIIVLLLLAVVAIGAVQNDGIINHAKNARDKYGKAQVNENTTLGEYLDKIEANLPGNNGGKTTSEPATMEEALDDSMLTKTVNSDVTDKYNNKITVPAGFKILVDDTTEYTAKDIDVTKGIVIQDAKGNEFVWVPVGKIYTTTDTEKTEENTKTINLDRYIFAENGTPIPQGDDLIDTYYQELATSEYGNATAKDLQGFINSATTKGGYYLARFEAGVENGVLDTSEMINYSTAPNCNWTGYVAEEGKELELVSKKDVQVWNYVTQNKASELSRNMYKEATTFTSDLINSYAWDTAIVFIQTFSTEADASNYANLNKGIMLDDINADKYCNIHNMSSRVCEWSTETSRYADNPCVSRGGESSYGYPERCTSRRNLLKESFAYSSDSFRSLLYLAL